MQSAAEFDRIRDRELNAHLDTRTECRRYNVFERRTTDLLVEIDRRIEQARRINDEVYCSVQDELSNVALNGAAQGD